MPSMFGGAAYYKNIIYQPLCAYGALGYIKNGSPDSTKGCKMPFDGDQNDVVVSALLDQKRFRGKNRVPFMTLVRAMNVDVKVA